MRMLRWLPAIAAFVVNNVTMAQTWSISTGSIDIAFGSTLYIASAYQRAGAPVGIKDTVSGTGFLIANNNKVYLLTAKHVIVKNLRGKNQQQVNNILFLSTSWKNDDEGVVLSGLSDHNIRKKPFILSSDREDLAIIFFQNKNYRKILAEFLKRNCKPIPVDSIDRAKHYAGESFFLVGYDVRKDLLGNKMRSHSLRPGKIKTYALPGPLFRVKTFISAGNNGAPLLLKNKK